MGPIKFSLLILDYWWFYLHFFLFPNILCAIVWNKVPRPPQTHTNSDFKTLRQFPSLNAPLHSSTLLFYRLKINSPFSASFATPLEKGRVNTIMCIPAEGIFNLYFKERTIHEFICKCIIENTQNGNFYFFPGQTAVKIILVA